MEHFLAQFASLPQDDRARIISELASHFRPSDWWHVDTLLQRQRKHICFDIIPNLPVELAVLVLRYLPLPDLFACRTVSRRWIELLRSEAICRGLAVELFPEDARAFSCQLLGTDTVVTRGDWTHFFEDVASRAEFVPSPTLFHVNNGRLAIYNRAIGDPAKIAVFDLEYYPACSQFSVPNREWVEKLLLTSDILAVVTLMGACHAWDLVTEQRKTLRVESGCYSHFTGKKGTLVMIYENSIIVWDTLSGVSWRIEDGLPRLSVSNGYEIGCLVDIENRIMSVCHFNKFEPAVINVYKIPFGRPLTEEITAQSLRWDVPESCSGGTIYSYIQPLHEDYMAVNWVYEEKSTKAHRIITLAYDIIGKWVARSYSPPEFVKFPYVLLWPDKGTVMLVSLSPTPRIYLGTFTPNVQWTEWRTYPHPISNVVHCDKRHFILCTHDGKWNIFVFRGIHEQKARGNSDAAVHGPRI
ncbi:hypothetical protein BDZ91DRAFT_390294 [Kalaharituber pfeilii]|nr:hypothetical protein BDZ91DRAFT_390294 [Kalaharituber pfeilii]